MQLQLVFQNADEAPHGKIFTAQSCEAGAELGRSLANENPEVFGEFLYARPAARVPLTLDALYVLAPSPLHLKYRKESEALYGAFDYISYSGAHQQDVCFELHFKDPATQGEVKLSAWFGAGRAGKFADMCKAHYAKFVLKAGKPVLQFCDKVMLRPVIEIDLERKH